MTIPATMRACVLTGHGGMDKLVHHRHWPVPDPTENQVLIKVSACGMNNTDINTRSGWYSKAVTEATTGGAYTHVDEEDPTWGGSSIVFPRIQGADVCGHIVAVGQKVRSVQTGQRVITDNWLRNWDDPLNKESIGYFGSECDGGYAEYTVIDHRNVCAIDSNLTDAELATFSCSYTTAEGMLSRAQVNSSDTVLITGASGGVGSALIQLAKRRGATVVGLASESKHDALTKLGADALLPRNPQDIRSTLRESIGSDQVTVVADIVGGDSFSELLGVLKRGGRYTCSGAIAGPIVEMDLRTFYLHDLTLTGSTIVPPEIFTNLVKYIERRELQPVLAACYPLSDFHTAQQAFIDKKHSGNIVVTMD